MCQKRNRSFKIKLKAFTENLKEFPGILQDSTQTLRKLENFKNELEIKF